MENYPDFFDAELLRKREELCQQGYTPYPYDFIATHKVIELCKNEKSLTDASTVVTVAGRIKSQRNMGASRFMDVYDETGKIQIYLNKSNLDSRNWNLLANLLDLGDYVLISGNVFRTRTGELSIKAVELQVLAKSVVRIPYGKEDKEQGYYQLNDPEIMYRERYLYWTLNGEARNLMELRSRIITAIRNWMTKEGFMEVQTPTVEMIYGGAEARPFETKIWALQNKNAFLRISPELYLKRYIVGGFPKVFSICQNFRNEGIDKSHNPEFSMMEWYEVGTDYNFQMSRFETLVADIAKEVLGSTIINYQGVEIDLAPPWNRLSVVDAIAQYVGLDVLKATAEELENFLAERNIKFPSGSAKGILIASIFEQFCEKHLIQPTFVIDHPIEISPLTKTKRGQPEFVERFEPFIFSMEIGNAYSELTDPVEQYNRFKQQKDVGSGEDFETHPLDYDFIKAVGIGMPPTGGVGLGIDRLIMLLTNSKSIREIIPFPMMKPKQL